MAGLQLLRTVCYSRIAFPVYAGFSPVRNCDSEVRAFRPMLLPVHPTRQLIQMLSVALDAGERHRLCLSDLRVPSDQAALRRDRSQFANDAAGLKLKRASC